MDADGDAKGRRIRMDIGRSRGVPDDLDAKEMVLSMPPIINGEYTRIDEATRDIFIDITGYRPEGDYRGA